jgi:hypothetical protein
MNLKTGLKVFSAAAAALVLAGCMTNGDSNPDTRATNAQKIKFVNAAVIAPVAQVTAEGFPGQGGNGEVDPEMIKSKLQQLGCPRLLALFEDYLEMDEDSDEIPKSFLEVLSCFNLKADASPDSLGSSFTNPTEFLDCLCGGTGLSDLLGGNAGKIALFSSASSKAGTAFSVSSSNAGGSFNGASSKPGGSTYSGSSSNGYSNP